MPIENYRDHLTEAKHQQELLKDYFNHVGHWLGSRIQPEMCQPTTLRAKESCIYQFLRAARVSGFIPNFKWSRYASCWAKVMLAICTKIKAKRCRIV